MTTKKRLRKLEMPQQKKNALEAPQTLRGVFFPDILILSIDITSFEG